MDDREHPAAGTKDRIMDAAERLFADNGFRGTSIKRLAREAKVNQAAVNYHFGSKAALIEKVIERRMRPVNQQCMQLIASVQKAAARKGCRPLTKDVLRAFIEPAFSCNPPMPDKWYFLALTSRAYSDPDATIRKIFTDQLKPPLTLLFQAMKKALPSLPEDVLLQRLHFAVGAITHCMRWCSVNLPDPGLLPPVGDLGTTKDFLLDFVTDGVCSPYPRDKEQ